MIKNLLLIAALATLTISISANTNTNELEKFNNAKSTISFTENKGQVSDQNYNPRPDVLFSGAANGLTFHIRNNGVSYQTSRVDSWKQKDAELPEGLKEDGGLDSVPDQMTIYRTDINWLGFNKDYTIENGESTAGFNNYYLPSSPEGAMNVKSYGEVTFKNLYDGIDVKWYEKNGELEYDFIVAPNTDYTKISWEIKGADRISIGENGQLIIETPLGNIEEQAPIAFQGETIVEAAWKIEGNKISFQLGSYNENEVLIIDPVVRQWGAYYGGTGTDNGISCATDASGNIYLSGQTFSSTGIATTGAHQTTYGGGAKDAFLVKFNSSGVRQWGTYYGGTVNNYGLSCATDTSGNIYLLGQTSSSTGIATTGAHQATSAGGTDAFLVKFNSSGVRQWGTYYGGLNVDIGYSCATDTSGNVYLSGNTWGSTTGIATTGAHQTTYGGGAKDAFLVKFHDCKTSYSQDTITACDSYTWIDNITYTSSNTSAKDTLVNVWGCDSVVTLNLTINSNTGTDVQTACDSYTWINDITYTSSNTSAKDTLVNVWGCDSVVTLNLTINTVNDSVYATGNSLTSVETGAQYQWLDCVFNFGILGGETGQYFIATANGSYAVQVTKNGCTDTSNCYVLKNVGLANSLKVSGIKVYPNPTNGKVTIDAENFEGVEVYDTSGRLIIKSALKTIDLEEQSKGLYLLKVNANGTIQEFKVLKE